MHSGLSHEGSRNRRECGNCDGALFPFREKVRNFGTPVVVGHDCDNREHLDTSFGVFAREVVPTFNDAIGAAH